MADIELLAKEAAYYAKFNSTKIKGASIGAVVQYGQNIYGGWNSRITHPIQARYARNPFSIYLHAEIAAMIRAKWKADRIVIVRILADGSWAMARPCSGCSRAIDKVPEVWYSDLEGRVVFKP